jgi:hypothetical protein
MPALEKSVVTLRISGDTLVPDEITQLLGATPTTAQAKGEEIVHPRTGARRTAKSGLWRLCAPDRAPEDMDAQIQELLGQLTSDLSIWQQIAATHHLDLFCGLFMGETNDGLVLSPESLVAVGQRRIELQLDIYAPSPDEATPAPNHTSEVI